MEKAYHNLYKYNRSYDEYNYDGEKKCFKKVNCRINWFLGVTSLFCIGLFITGSLLLFNGFSPNILCQSKSEHRVGNNQKLNLNSELDNINDKNVLNEKYILLQNCNDTNLNMIPFIKPVFCYDSQENENSYNLCFNVTMEAYLYQYGGIIIIFISIMSQFLIISCFYVNKILS